jgi:heme exporter protein A
MSGTGIELRGVGKTYGPVRALVGISCIFAAGTVTVVRGPNGSGKSTLLSIVGTLTRQTTGSVSYGDLGTGRADVRRTLGWVGHESLCYPDLTGRENIELAARLHGRVAAQAYASARDRFDLDAFAERPVRTYSRGQRQRIALARALVHSPRLLLLDEPTTGLDSRGMERLRTLLVEEARRGAVIVAVTHDDTFADTLGGSALWLDRGRAISDGRPPR